MRQNKTFSGGRNSQLEKTNDGLISELTTERAHSKAEILGLVALSAAKNIKLTKQC
jgi:hypothetical protein